MAEVKLFKLVSGEMCIGTVKSEQPDADSIEVNIPMLLHYAPHPSGQLSINFFPLNPFANRVSEDIIFKKNHIMFFVDAVTEEMRNEYIKITSGITVAKNIPQMKVPQLTLK